MKLGRLLTLLFMLRVRSFHYPLHQLFPTFVTVRTMTTHLASANSEIVHRRLQIIHEKKQARVRSIWDAQQRNQRLKQATNDIAGTMNLCAIKVSIDSTLRKEMNMSRREKTGRMFVELDSDATKSLAGLKNELHDFFRVLRKGTYLLQAGIPTLTDDGRVISTARDGILWPINSDTDIEKTFQYAEEFFGENTEALKRPTILLVVSKDPNVPGPPPLPSYLKDLPDPSQTPTVTMLSFYAFPPSGIPDPEEFSTYLRRLWKPFEALGRVYVAQEGLNAQMSVPTSVLSNFVECCRSIPGVGDYIENGINIDPIPLTREEFSIAGTSAGYPAPPFSNLHIRVRQKIVADGLTETLDWQSAGYDMPPLEWHTMLKRITQENDTGASERPIILDCRNSYESDVGHFKGAEAVNTQNFRDTWEVLETRLKNVPKDTPIYGYCTGGIRCVKVGAYVTQKMGFNNFSRLAGGIIAYDRTLQEKAPNEEPLFKGTNFVFDGRLGRPITEDAMATCVTCQKETSHVGNCRNLNCHKRMVQCPECEIRFVGTCSDACRQRVLTDVMRVKECGGTAAAMEATELPSFTSIEEYSSQHSSPIPSVLKEMELNTNILIPSGSQMVSGDTQGRLLTQLASMTREGRILEIGTFTGYSAACFLEGSLNVARSTRTIGTIAKGPCLLTMERDSRAFDIAVAHLSIISKEGVGRDEVAEAVCALRSEGGHIRPASCDRVILDYCGKVQCQLLKVADALVALEGMASGLNSELDSVAPFDMVFLDADKARMLDYVEACLSSDRVLKKGGHIVIDNVLWKGFVLNASSSTEPDGEGCGIDGRSTSRDRKLAGLMHEFNSKLLNDPRVEVLILPVRDGLSVVRKK